MIRYVPLSVALFLFGTVLFYFMGTSSKGWTVFFYALDKLMISFLLLVIGSMTRIKWIRMASYYGMSLCLFMFLYFLWCYSFGHDSIFVTGSLLGYSAIVLILLKQRVS